MIAWVAAAVVVWTILGWAVVRLVAGPTPATPGARSTRLGLAIGIGTGMTTLVQFWADAMGLGMGLHVQLMAAAGLAVVGGVVAVRHAMATGRSPSAPSRPSRPLDRLLTLVLVVGVGLVLAGAISAPLTQWDPRTIWAFKAKILHDAGTVESEHFRDPDRVHPHPRYPLLVPLAEVGLWQWTGRADERTVKVLSPLFLAARLLVMAGLLQEHVGRTGALLLTATVAWCPMLCVHEWGACSAHADVPLAFFHTAATLLLLRWMRTHDLRTAGLAGVCAALGIFTKNEGLALWACNLVGVTVVVIAVRPRRALAGWLLLAGVPLLLNLPWLVVQAGLPNVADENYVARLMSGELAPHIHRLPAVAAAVAYEMFVRVDRWSAIWIVAVLLVAADLRRACRPRSAVLVGGLVLYVVTIVLMYTVSPWDDISMHMAVSLPRVLVPIVGPAVALMAVQLGTGRNRSTEVLPPEQPRV